ncbi:MAG: efflux RND transporter periplasmic adaptor subunit [Acidobacteriia bacterium]|nr:efflux RND transporter periplasmic adaptor subunit [Terriglobia bacterium]
MLKYGLACLLVAVAALSGCEQSRPVAIAQASAEPVARESLAKTAAAFYEASGPLVVENQVDVAAQREGVVAKIQSDVGASVKKGHLLAQLDDRQLTADRDAAKAKADAMEADYKHWQAQLKMREADLARSEAMWKAQLITAQQFEHDRYAVESGKFFLQRQGEDLKNTAAALKSAQLELDKTRIVAPFDGVVARRYVRAGQKVALGDRLFWVTATGPLNVRFTVPQALVAKVQRGDMVSLVAPGAGGAEHKAKITLISPVVDPSSGTIEVQAQVLGPAGELRPGMTVNLRVKTP